MKAWMIKRTENDGSESMQAKGGRLLPIIDGYASHWCFTSEKTARATCTRYMHDSGDVVTLFEAVEVEIDESVVTYRDAIARYCYLHKIGKLPPLVI